jgi:hypothetical protein
VRRADIRNLDRLLIKNLRGRLFPFWQPDFAAYLAEYCKRKSVHLVIIDTQAAAMRGFVKNENDNMEVSRWHGTVDDFLYMGEVPNCLITHHMGYGSSEHGRGASSMGGWPEVLWFMTKDEVFVGKPGESAPRSFRSEGRDSTLDAVELVFNSVTGLYSYEGVPQLDARRETKIRAWMSRLVSHYTATGSWPNMEKAKGLSGVKAKYRSAYVKLAVEHGYVAIDLGAHGAKYVRVLGMPVPGEEG